MDNVPSPLSQGDNSEKCFLEEQRGGKWEEEHRKDACVCLLGYMQVVQIPKGSVHLEIKELTMSKNYIGKGQICKSFSSTFCQTYYQFLSVFYHIAAISIQPHRRSCEPGPRHLSSRTWAALVCG